MSVRAGELGGPGRACAPGALATSADSPVSMASSQLPRPATTSPSTGTRSPGSTCAGGGARQAIGGRSERQGLHASPLTLPPQHRHRALAGSAYARQCSFEMSAEPEHGLQGQNICTRVPGSTWRPSRCPLVTGRDGSGAVPVRQASGLSVVAFEGLQRSAGPGKTSLQRTSRRSPARTLAVGTSTTSSPAGAAAGGPRGATSGPAAAGTSAGAAALGAAARGGGAPSGSRDCAGISRASVRRSAAAHARGTASAGRGRQSGQPRVHAVTLPSKHDCIGPAESLIMRTGHANMMCVMS